MHKVHRASFRGCDYRDSESHKTTVGASQLGRPRIADGSESVLLGVEFAELHLCSEPKQELRVGDSGECVSSDKVREDHPKFKKISGKYLLLTHT